MKQKQITLLEFENKIDWFQVYILIFIILIISIPLVGIPLILLPFAIYFSKNKYLYNKAELVQRYKEYLQNLEQEKEKDAEYERLKKKQEREYNRLIKQ